MIQQTLEFQFREANNRDNYIVGRSNIEAVKWIDNYPNWKGYGLIIEGPKASGKTHLVSVWQKKSNCVIIESEQINSELVDVEENNNVAIEDIHNINNYEFFLHLINYKKEKKLNCVLTSNKSIKAQNIYLNDIKSRLLEMPKVYISLPTDEIIKGILHKLLKGKGILVDNKLLDYMLNRINRSYEGINNFTEKLNKKSLEKKKKISMSMIKEVLDYGHLE